MLETIWAHKLILLCWITLGIGIVIWLVKTVPGWVIQLKLKSLIKKSAAAQRNNPYLQGNFAPVLDELQLDDLPVEGILPHDLSGIYMRNGPTAAFPPYSYTYPFDGDGMLHAIYLHDGKARYKNRFIVTDQFQVEQREGKAMYGGVNCPFIRDSQLLKPGDSQFPVKIGRFIHIIRHAKRYLALHEGTTAYEMDADLQTLGEWNPNPEQEAIEVNAHTRLDPNTGELYLMCYFEKPIIRVHMLDKHGHLTQSCTFNVPNACMIHDFVLTQHYVIIFICPVTVDFMGTVHGRDFVQWKPELNTQIALLNRADLNKEAIWLETESFFTYHFANAYESGPDIIIDHARYPSFSVTNIGPSSLYRTRLNVAQRTCVHQQLDMQNVEFPRINEQYNANPYKYIYALANSDHRNPDLFSSIIKYDLSTNQSTAHHFGARYELSEVVFAPNAHGQQEDDGYLLFFMYDRQEQKSSFVVLDAQHLAAPPLAIVHLPNRVPNGLHGSWFANT